VTLVDSNGNGMIVRSYYAGVRRAIRVHGNLKRKIRFLAAADTRKVWLLRLRLNHASIANWRSRSKFLRIKLTRNCARRRQKVAGQYRIPGFRKGKAPYHIVVQQFGLSNLYSEFIDELGQTLFRDAIAQEKIEPYAQSSLEDIQLEPLTYRLIVPLEPEVKLGDYHTLRVEEDAIEVDEAEVERRLANYQDEYAGWREVERPSQYGDLLSANVRSVIAEDDDETVVLDERIGTSRSTKKTRWSQPVSTVNC
jgi:hypothetical protein